MALLRIGVDCGGTNTDAVCLSADNRVLGWAKQATSEDVLHGIVGAVAQALQSTGQDPAAVGAVMLGTTQFVNATVQLKGLAKVAVVRLCGPATHSLPPFCNMPPRLREAVGGCYFLAAGGYEFDGSSELSPLNERQLRSITRQVLAAGIRCVVVSGVFSPVQAAQEQRAAEIVQEEEVAAAADAGTVQQQQQQPLFVCQSHEVGQLGLLERENAAVLNASLQPLAHRVVPACVQALAAVGIQAPLLFTSNDGTLLSAQQALKLPVATFQSGPVNSLRGTALLTGLQHAAVIDIGGTTTDVGLLVGGLPRPAPRTVRFAGAPTNFQMPDVLSIGLGGGSIVRFFEAVGGGNDVTGSCGNIDSDGSIALAAVATAAAGCTVGPDSVGARLPQEALCMGGGTCTVSDVAVMLGRMELGSRQAAAAVLSEEQVTAAWAVIQRELEACVDAIKTEAGDLPVIVVGGGAPLCGASLRGASSVVCPQHAAVANAVGAAITHVSGTVDAVYNMGGTAFDRAEILQQVEQLATKRAVHAGARRGSCWVAARAEVPLAYLPGSTSRVMVKVVGDLDLSSLHHFAATSSGDGDGNSQRQAVPSRGAAPAAGQEQAAASPAALKGWPPLPGRDEDPSLARLAGWQPRIDQWGGWVIHPEDLHLIAIGTGILGCGGGGSPGKAMLQGADAAAELVADAGYMGAPTVGIEKLDADQAEAAVKAVLAAYRSTVPSDGSGRSSEGASAVPSAQRQLAALMAGEVGGGNGIEPLVVGSLLGLPVVDGDLMGRAFPELQMMTSAIYGMPVLPAAVVDEKGNTVVVQQAASPAWLERLLRPACTEMGCSVGFSSCPLTGQQLKRVVVPHSLSLAWRLGAAVARAQHAKQDAPAAIAAAGGGRVLFTGKVVDVQRETTAGFARGRLSLEGSAACGGHTLRIEFQNENLLVIEGPGERLLASVPDLICCVEAENGQPIATEEQRYGLRVAVLGLPAHPLLTMSEALEVVGPAAFGYHDVQHVSLAQYVEPLAIPVGLPQQAAHHAGS